MKVQELAPGMIFTFKDRPLANGTASTYTTDSKTPVHMYMIVSVGSNACLQDIQWMKITSMRNKESTYELPIIVNEAVSYIVPYNIFSFRRDEVDMKFFKGVLVGDSDICSADEFLHLCRDIYTDVLFGELDSSLKTRIRDYQQKFLAKFSSVPQYESVRFRQTVVSENADTSKDIFPAVPESDESFNASIKWIDSMPAQYKSWTDQDIMRALLFLGNNSPLSVVSKSSRFKSVGTLDNVLRAFRKRINEIHLPIYTTIINGHEYKFSFKTGTVIGQTFNSDSHEYGNITVQIKKAMRIIK